MVLWWCVHTFAGGHLDNHLTACLLSLSWVWIGICCNKTERLLYYYLLLDGMRTALVPCSANKWSPLNSGAWASSAGESSKHVAWDHWGIMTTFKNRQWMSKSGSFFFKSLLAGSPGQMSSPGTDALTRAWNRISVRSARRSLREATTYPSMSRCTGSLEATAPCAQWTDWSPLGSFSPIRPRTANDSTLLTMFLVIIYWSSLLLDTIMSECSVSYQRDLRTKLFWGELGEGGGLLFFFLLLLLFLFFLLSCPSLLLLPLEITVFYF